MQQSGHGFFFNFDNYLQNNKFEDDNSRKYLFDALKIVTNRTICLYGPLTRKY